MGKGEEEVIKVIQEAKRTHSYENIKSHTRSHFFAICSGAAK
jgi:hypothetical protein